VTATIEVIQKRSKAMTRHDIRQWSQEQTEAEIQRWLIAQNLWQPDVLFTHTIPTAEEGQPIRVLTQAQASAVLQRSTMGRLSYQAGEHRAVIPLAYVYADDAIYGVLSSTLAFVLHDHPQVAFQVEQVTHPLEWQSVVLQGQAEHLTDAAADHARALFGNREGLPDEVLQEAAWVRITPSIIGGFVQEA
jgi:nitroimidazol reductase NimA-like FMN-containing flavoprotein (pyridoxamine 5'-phosphate oxidase superfamily)